MFSSTLPGWLSRRRALLAPPLSSSQPPALTASETMLDHACERIWNLAARLEGCAPGRRLGEEVLLGGYTEPGGEVLHEEHCSVLSSHACPARVSLVRLGDAASLLCTRCCQSLLQGSPWVQRAGGAEEPLGEIEDALADLVGELELVAETAAHLDELLARAATLRAGTPTPLPPPPPAPALAEPSFSCPTSCACRGIGMREASSAGWAVEDLPDQASVLDAVLGLAALVGTDRQHPPYAELPLYQELAGVLLSERAALAARMHEVCTAEEVRTHALDRLTGELEEYQGIWAGGGGGLRAERDETPVLLGARDCEEVLGELVQGVLTSHAVVPPHEGVQLACVPRWASEHALRRGGYDLALQIAPACTLAELEIVISLWDPTAEGVSGSLLACVRVARESLAL